MQSLSVNNEDQKQDETKVKRDLLSGSPNLEQTNVIQKLSTTLVSPSKIQPITRNRSDAKLQDVLSPVPHQKNNDIFAVRSFSKRMTEKLTESSIIAINVSGDRFQTRLSTLQLYPDTLLGNEEKRKAYWNPKTEEYFFDRHRACFEAILYYYQSQGRLRRPDFVPLDTFEEISFFELGQDAIDQIHKDENISKAENVKLPRTLWRRYIWFYMEYPDHSRLGWVISVISVIFTLLSCVSLAIESLPTYANRWDGTCINSTTISINVTTEKCSSLYSSPFFIIQTVCVPFFTIEFILRLLTTPSYRQFFLSLLTWVDLCTIIPYCVFLILQLTDSHPSIGSSAMIGIRILRVLRFGRILRLSRICRQMKSLRVLSATIRESLLEFGAMITILAMLAFIFGAATYFAEMETNYRVFDSIPLSLYWGVITITGVGYGDMYPISVAGRIITCFCALFGPVTMGMLVSVIVDRYQRVYNRKMYITEPDISPADLDSLSINTELRRSISTSQRLLRKQDKSHSIQSETIKMKDRSNPSPSTKTKELHRLQCHLDIQKDDQNESAFEHLISVMKYKLNEVLSSTDMEIHMKLINSDNQELWTISSPLNSTSIVAPRITITMQPSDGDEFEDNHA